MAGTKISAVDIKKLWYANPESVTADLTAAALKTLVQGATEITNVHQDTWAIEEAEPSVTRYKNQLTGNNYRQTKEMGDVTMSFTIGLYDYETKAALMGGTATATSWKRDRAVVDIYKCMIALTEDNQYVVFPKAAVSSRESNTDKAIGIAVTATALEPDTAAVMPEYWFDGVEAAGV